MAISAASMTKVPDPHIGSRTGSPPAVPRGAQEEGGQRLAHRRRVHLLLVAAAVQRLAGGVDGDGAEVVVDPHLQRHRTPSRLLRHRGAEPVADRRRDPRAGGAGMPDARGPRRDLDAQRHVRPERLAPGHLARALVELREMERAEGRDPREHAGRAAEVEVGPPDLGPAADEGDPAGDGLRLGEAERGRLVARGAARGRAGRRGRSRRGRTWAPA